MVTEDILVNKSYYEQYELIKELTFGAYRLIYLSYFLFLDMLRLIIQFGGINANQYLLLCR